jgi:hypothetical protein
VVIKRTIKDTTIHTGRIGPIVIKIEIGNNAVTDARRYLGRGCELTIDEINNRPTKMAFTE